MLPVKLRLDKGRDRGTSNFPSEVGSGRTDLGDSLLAERFAEPSSSENLASHGFLSCRTLPAEVAACTLV